MDSYYLSPDSRVAKGYVALNFRVHVVSRMQHNFELCEMLVCGLCLDPRSHRKTKRKSPGASV